MQAKGKVTDFKTSMCSDKLIFVFQTFCYKNIAEKINRGLPLFAFLSGFVLHFADFFTEQL